MKCGYQTRDTTKLANPKWTKSINAVYEHHL